MLPSESHRPRRVTTGTHQGSRPPLLRPASFRASLRSTYAYRGWWIVAACFFVQMIGSGASGWVFGVLQQPMGTDLGWSRATVVGAISVASLVGGLLAARLGPLVDRQGPRTLMTASLLVGGGAMIALSQVHSVLPYYVIWAVFGLTTPGFQLLGPVVVIANWFIRRRALAFMLYTFGSATAGIVLAPVMAFVASTWGWRTAWLTMGICICLLAPISWITVRRRPEDVGLVPDGLDEASAGANSASGPAGATATEAPWTVREALHTRAYWLLTAGFALQSLPSMSIFIFIAPYVVTKGFSIAAGASVVSVYGIGVLAGRPVWGTMIARAGMYRTLVMFTTIYGCIVIAFIVPTTLPPIYAAAIALGVAIAGGQQLQAQVFPDYFGRNVVGALNGYSGLAYTVSRAAGPVYAAFVFDATHSYVISFSSFAAASFLASLAFLLAPPPKHPSTVEAPVGQPARG